MTLRSGIERVGFWLVVAAAFAVLLLVMGALLPPVLGGIVAGTYMAMFVGGLTLANLRRPSAWANSLLGRKVFPVVRGGDGELLRLAGVNAALTFAFAFTFYVVAQFVGGFFAGIVVFGGLIAAGFFYSRVRKVVIKP